MPLIKIHFPEGAFTPEALDTLAAQISKDGGDLEKLADDPFVRSTTWVYAQEYEPAKVYHGGKPGGTRSSPSNSMRFKAALTQRRRRS